MDCFDKKKRLLFPTLAAYIADLVEAASVFNIQPFPANYPDENYIIHKNNLADLEPVLQKRTEAGTVAVRPLPLCLQKS